MTQHSVFVVDDEPLIVKGLCASIEHGMPSFHLVGTAYSGDEALEKILQTKPEIVISDIRMHGMDGLELARNLRQLLPYTKVILLSGYNEFEYAQSGIRYQVFDYLLKPVTDAALSRVLGQAAAAIVTQGQEKRHLSELMRHLDSGKPFLRHLLFSTLRSASLTGANPVLTLFGMEDEEYVYLPACVRFGEDMDVKEESGDDKKLLLFEQVQFIFHDLSVDLIPFYEQFVFVLLMRFRREGNDSLCESRAYTALEKVSTMIGLNYDRDFCIGVGPLTDRRADIPGAYALAKESTRYAFFFGSGSIISYNDINVRNGEGSAKNNWVEQMMLSIRAGAKEEALSQVKGYTDSLYKAVGTIYGAKRDCLHTCMDLWHEFGQNYLSEAKSEQLFCSVIGNLLMCSDIHAICDVLTELVENICQAISSALLDRNKQIAWQIQEIIERDYATVTLETISSAIHMSPAYISNLFSSTMGVTIRDTIINKRIECAKELLKHTDRKLYEIADAVGYSDAKYFSQVFRKVTGTTPNQYRYG